MIFQTANVSNYKLTMLLVLVSITYIALTYTIYNKKRIIYIKHRNILVYKVNNFQKWGELLLKNKL
jgi:hypothetical protein